MRITYIIQAFLLVTTISANSYRLYAKINNELYPISSISSFIMNVLALGYIQNSPISKFNITQGFASTEFEGENQIFGVVKDYLVFGTEDLVKPVPLIWDSRMKITSLTPYICKNKQARTQPVFMNSDHTSSLMYCEAVEIYLEGEEGEREQKEVEKREEEEEEDMQSDQSRGDIPKGASSDINQSSQRSGAVASENSGTGIGIGTGTGIGIGTGTGNLGFNLGPEDLIIRSKHVTTIEGPKSGVSVSTSNTNIVNFSPI